MVRLNVVIATHRRRLLLQRALASLAEARRPEGFEQVIVIENGSDDGTRGVCREAPGGLPVRYQHQAQPGKSRALQSCLEKLGGGFALFLDDDVRVCPDLLTEYADAAQQGGKDTIYGGPLRVDYEDKPPPAWLNEFLPFTARGWEPDDPDEALRYDRFLGPNYGAFVNRILSVGGFNPDIGPGAQFAGTERNPVGQETEMQNRLREDGCRSTYLPNAVVWHWVPADRCTVRWAHQRWYRHGITDGMRDRDSVGGARLGGTPRWTWSVWLRLAASAAAANLIADPRCRFMVKREFSRWRGYMEGRRRQSRSATES